MVKSKSAHAGRMAVLDFLREEGIQIVPVPHGDRKTDGQIVVMLGDGTWLEFDTQKQVVDWLAEHMERRGVPVHNPIRLTSRGKRLRASSRFSLEKDSRGWNIVDENGRVWDRGYRLKADAQNRKDELDGIGAKDRFHVPSKPRRNPSSGMKFWWLIITRDDATAVGHRYESRESMMHYSKKHAANLRGDNSKALIRGTEPMTTAAFRKAFKTAYPKFTLEV